MTESGYLPTKETWDETLAKLRQSEEQNRILAHQAQKNAKKLNRLFKIELLLKATGFKIGHDERGRWYLEGHGVLHYPAITE
jgi:hypothetical protein